MSDSVVPWTVAHQAPLILSMEFPVCGISQSRILEWVAIFFFRVSSQIRDQTHVSCTGRWVLYQRATRVLFGKSRSILQGDAMSLWQFFSSERGWILTDHWAEWLKETVPITNYIPTRRTPEFLTFFESLTPVFFSFFFFFYWSVVELWAILVAQQ